MKGIGDAFQQQKINMLFFNDRVDYAPNFAIKKNDADVISYIIGMVMG